MFASKYIRHFISAILGVAAFATACGGASVSSDTVGEATEQVEVGSAWSGTVTHGVAGLFFGRAYHAVVTSAPVGGGVSLSGFGPKSDGAISLTGAGGILAWAGAVVVQEWSESCPGATTEYTSGEAAFIGGTLTLRLSGVSHQCDGDHLAVLSFVSNERSPLRVGPGAYGDSQIDCDANPTAPQCCEQTGMCPVSVTIPVTVDDATGQNRSLYVALKSEKAGTATQTTVVMNGATVSSLSTQSTATFSEAMTTTAGRYLTFTVKDLATGGLTETGMTIPSTGLRCAGGISMTEWGPMPYASCFNQ